MYIVQCTIIDGDTEKMLNLFIAVLAASKVNYCVRLVSTKLKRKKLVKLSSDKGNMRGHLRKHR